MLIDYGKCYSLDGVSVGDGGSVGDVDDDGVDGDCGSVDDGAAVGIMVGLVLKCDNLFYLFRFSSQQMDDRQMGKL